VIPGATTAVLTTFVKGAIVPQVATVHTVWCENSADRLSGPPFVVVENSAQSFMAVDFGIRIDCAAPSLAQPIIESLMIPLEVIVLDVFLHSVA